MNYKDAVYSSYRSAFKGSADAASLSFGAAKLRPVVEPWVREVPRDAKVVDLGCGAGELLLAFKGLGFTNLAGCDLSSQQIEMARSVTADVQVANLFEYLDRCESVSVDILTLFDVLEHLTRQEAFELLQVMHEKLKPGGIVIGHVPNGLSPFVGHVYFGDPTHEWCPTPSAMRTLLSVSNFGHFEAVEHLGASTTLKGRIRSVGWRFLRQAFKISNLIETGEAGGGIWTRNFAFTAVSVPAPSNLLR